MEDADLSRSASHAYPLLSTGSKLPSGWNPRDKGPYIGLGRNNLRAFYKGPGKTQKDAAAVRANRSIPVACGIYYYEVKISTGGKGGHFAIGIATNQASLEKLPGWERSSYGFHTDDGNVFHANEAKKDGYGRKAGSDDVIGCGVDMVQRSCFFTLNGNACGTAFTDLANPVEEPLYPVVGMNYAGEDVEVNFGEKEFVFDIASVREEQKKAVLETFGAFQMEDNLPTAVSGLQEMVLSYLTTHGYLDTAQKLGESTGKLLHDDERFVQNRRDVLHLVTSGQISSALAALSGSYPELLANNAALHIQLCCQQFVEMVVGTDDGHGRTAVTCLQSTNSAQAQQQSGSSSTGVVNARGAEAAGAATAAPPPAQAMANGEQRHVNGTGGTGSGLLPDSGHHSGGTTSESEPMDTGDSVTEDEPMEQHSSVDIPTKPATTLDADSKALPSAGSQTNISKADSRHSSSKGASTQNTPCEELPPSERSVNGSSAAEESAEAKLQRIVEFGVGLQKKFDDLQSSDTVTADTVAHLRQTLKDTFSTLAYVDFGQCPVRYMVSPAYREALSRDVNSAMLESKDCLPVSTLEVMAAHARHCVQRLAEKGLAKVTHLNARDLCS